MANPKQRSKIAARGVKKQAHYTSVYLDVASQKRLAELEKEWGVSRSKVIRILIQSADGAGRDRRLIELVKEMSDLLAVK